MPAPSFAGAGTGQNGQAEGGTLSCGLGITAEANDIGFFFYGVNSESGTPTPPSGWTQVRYLSAADYVFALWWKRFVGGETIAGITDGSGGTSLSSSNGHFARAYVFRGASTAANPFNAQNETTQTTSTTPQTAAVTTTINDCLILNFCFLDTGDTAWSSGHPPSGWADQTADFTATSGADGRLCVIGKTQATPATVSAVTVGTQPAPVVWFSYTIALSPAADPTIPKRGIQIYNVADMEAAIR
jgi:hypothetical protein